MDENKKDRKSNLIIVLLLLIILILIGACYFAYSRYTSTESGSGTTSVAKWNFGTTTELTGLDLATTSTANGTLFDTVNNVVTDKIAPGTQGSFSIDLGTSGTEVAVQYDILLSNLEKPENLHFYSDAARSEANRIDATNGSSASLSGYIAQADTGSTHTITIYWKWPYQTGTVDANGVAEGDAQDTTDGEAAENVTFNLTVRGTQVNPGDTQVRTSSEAVAN